MLTEKDKDFESAMETQPPEELGVSADVVDDDKEEAVVATQSAVLPGGVFKETVVAINRVAKVVSGGKRLAFSAVAVVGDGNGQVGVGKGKARDVQNSILKAVNQAKKHLVRVPLKNSTIPVAIVGTFGAARVLLRPAAPGTGVIAGGPVRAVVEACGIKDILTKSLGTSNIHNVLYATISALTNLRTKEEVARKRGKKPEDI